MPAHPIIDTHVHLWNPTVVPVPWLVNEAAMNHVNDAQTLLDQTKSVPLDGYLFIEVNVAHDRLADEVDWATSQSQIDPRLRGIIAGGWVEEGQDFARYLDHIGTNRLVKGIRRVIANESDPAFCLRDEVVQGIAQVSQRDLVFEICCKTDQLAAVARMVKLLPATRFVLEHLAFPEYGGDRRDAWRAQMQQVAAAPNVVAKLSGMVTAAGSNWTEEQIRPYAQDLLETFGVDRVMFGSGWPVVTTLLPYRDWVALATDFVADLNEHEQNAFWSATARQWYRL